MSVDFAIGTPFANALQVLVQPKLAEYGWTTGDPEDLTVFEYILLMLGNNKNEAQIASELSNDLLDLGPDNVETQEFARWLFQQISELTGGNTQAPQSSDAPMESAPSENAATAQDTDMEGTTDSGQMYVHSLTCPHNVNQAEANTPHRPTGPKAMRNGSGSGSASGSGAKSQQRGGGRMINNINRQMGRTDDPLHRVRGSGGAGRINSHSRDPPKGPRSDNIGRGLAAMANGRGQGNVGMSMGPGAMNAMNGMNGMNGMMPPMPGPMGSMPMPPMGGNGMPGMLNPQQHMALMQMYEQQAQMMQQILTGQTPAAYVNPNFPHQRKNGRPISERVDRSRQGGKNSLPPSNKFTRKDGQDENMADTGVNAEEGEASAMDVEGGRPEPFNVVCKFNTRCSKPDCPFAHQSPAAPEGTPLDMQDTCTFGAKCTNKKCVGKHPSPAQKYQFQTEQECAFFPNCRDPVNCPYKHPSMPACRNGADCTTPGCKFWHNSIMCKFNPCTNVRCPYKHVEGQKKVFKDKVWVASKDGEEKNQHVSERKFIDEDAEEELIIPGKSESEKGDMEMKAES